MSELRVPTVALEVEVVCADGRISRGRVFVPDAAQHHTGPTRAEEWLNEPAAFFPFLPEDRSDAVILNKREILLVTVPAEADTGDIPELTESPSRRVAIETGGRRLEGTIVIDMPQNQRRALDYLNRPEPFLTLRSGEHHHLVLKQRIARVIENRED